MGLMDTLPVELRIKIFELALTPNNAKMDIVIREPSIGGKLKFATRNAPQLPMIPFAPPLLRTCKKIREECKDIGWKPYMLTFETTSIGSLQMKLSTVDTQRLHGLRSITLQIDRKRLVALNDIARENLRMLASFPTLRSITFNIKQYHEAEIKRLFDKIGNDYRKDGYFHFLRGLEEAGLGPGVHNLDRKIVFGARSNRKRAPLPIITWYERTLAAFPLMPEFYAAFGGEIWVKDTYL